MNYTQAISLVNSYIANILPKYYKTRLIENPKNISSNLCNTTYIPYKYADGSLVQSTKDFAEDIKSLNIALVDSVDVITIIDSDEQLYYRDIFRETYGCKKAVSEIIKYSVLDGYYADTFGEIRKLPGNVYYIHGDSLNSDFIEICAFEGYCITDIGSDILSINTIEMPSDLCIKKLIETDEGILYDMYIPESIYNQALNIVKSRCHWIYYVSDNGTSYYSMSIVENTNTHLYSMDKTPLNIYPTEIVDDSSFKIGDELFRISIILDDDSDITIDPDDIEEDD